MKTTPDSRLRVAVVGCGAVTQANLMPVLAGHDGLDVRALVDRHEPRARDLANAYSVARTASDLDAIVDDVDAVVLATPPAHHAPATIALAGRGKHVLVEKPMAITRADAERMVEAADRAGVVLAVGLYRRLLPSVRLLATLIEQGTYGRPLAADIEEGGPYGWGLATLDVLTRAGGGGGVLIDIGSHVIDLLLGVLPGTPRLTAYADNARGGIETDCEARFVVAHPTGEVPVRLELSRTHELRGTIRVTCERATLELVRGNFTQLVVHPREETRGASPFHVTTEWAGQQPHNGYDAFRAEIDDWVTAIRTGVAPVLSGRSVVPVVGLIEDCYANRTPLAEPWTDAGLEPRTETARISVGDRRRKVLITGAGGFLGGRAAEVLSQRYGWEVVSLVREPKSAARLARWTGSIVVGDICSPADMDRAMAGCDAVIHCAVGTSWKPDEVRKVTVDGTRTVAEAAQRAGVKRLVHISTMFVHRRDGTGTLDETTPLEPPANDDYGRNKLLAEQAVAAVSAKGLSSVILRPTRIYGPFSRTFTVRPLDAISDGRFGILGDPDVPGNMVYVDNVVLAMAKAIEAESPASAAAYLITDDEQLSLREFYQYFADTIGRTIRLLPGSVNGTSTGPKRGLLGQWSSGLVSIAKSSELRGFVRRVFETDPVGTIPRRFWDRSPGFQQSMLRRFGADAAVIYRPPSSDGREDLPYWAEPMRVTSAKAARELGYTDLVPREEAMALTLAWAQYARLLRAETPT